MKKKKNYERQTADQLFANNFENARKQLLALDGKKKIFPEDFFESMDFGISDKNEISDEFQRAKKGNVKGPDAVIKWICKEMSWDFDECKFDGWEDYWNFFLGLVFSFEYNEHKLPSFDDDKEEINDTMLPSELISELEMVNRFMPEPFSEEEEKLKKMSQRELLLKEIDERLEDVYKKYEDDDDAKEDEEDDEE